MDANARPDDDVFDRRLSAAAEMGVGETTARRLVGRATRRLGEALR